MIRVPYSSSFFFFNDTATTEIYTLSLHDALPILLGAHEVVEGLVPVDRALVVDVEEAEIRVGEGGGHGERHRDDAQPPRRRAAGGQPEEDHAEGEKEEEPERAEFLVGIQNVQKERMRRSTRSSWDWNGSLQRIVSRSGSLSFR